jgi:hypothetical protein
MKCGEDRYVRTNWQHHLRLQPFLFVSKLHKYSRSRGLNRIFRDNGTRHLDGDFQSQIFCYHARLYTHIFFSTTICTCFFITLELGALEGTLFLHFLRSFVLYFLRFLLSYRCRLRFGTPGHSCSCSCLEWCARTGICCERGRRTRFGITRSVRWLVANSGTGTARFLVTIKGSLPCLAAPRPQSDHLKGREASTKTKHTTPELPLYTGVFTSAPHLWNCSPRASIGH